jgi:hypothetical protein
VLSIWCKVFELLKHNQNSGILVILLKNKEIILVNLLKVMLATIAHNSLEKGIIFVVVPYNIPVEELCEKLNLLKK